MRPATLESGVEADAMAWFVLVDHRDPSGRIGPGRRPIGVVEMSSHDAADFNRAAVRTPFRLWPREAEQPERYGPA
jgi:hypothetical protein